MDEMLFSTWVTCVKCRTRTPSPRTTRLRRDQDDDGKGSVSNQTYAAMHERKRQELVVPQRIFPSQVA